MQDLSYTVIAFLVCVHSLICDIVPTKYYNSRLSATEWTRQGSPLPRKANPLVCLRRHPERLGVAPEYYGVWAAFPESYRRGVGITSPTRGSLEGKHDLAASHNTLSSIFRNTRERADGSTSNILSGVQATPSGSCTQKPLTSSFTFLARISSFSKAI